MGERSDRRDGSAKSADAARQERLAQALRANLKRRKAQARGRVATVEPGPAPDDSEN